MASTRCPCCMQPIDTPVCPYCGYPETLHNDDHQLSVGTLLRQRYQVGRVLGQGGFGITYLGWDDAFGRKVAIKEYFPSSLVNRQKNQGSSVILNSASTQAGFRSGRERFLREAQALSRMDHIPQIVRIYDFFQENNTAYIVMEFIRGVELGRYVRNRGGRLEVEETLRILKPILTALETVHKLGLVHRDISPDNIMLDPMGGAKLLDFGAVRNVENPDAGRDLEKSTEAIVKHGFAPAEQYRGRGSLGPWTDLYALCATIYFCITGKVPPDALGLAMGEEQLDWSGISGLTEAQRRALTKGMSPRAEDRYKDLGLLRQDLYGEAPRISPEAEPVEEKDPPAAREPIPVISREPAEMEKTCNVTDTREPSRDIPEEKPEGRKKNPVGIAVLVVLLLAVASFLALIIPYRRSVNRYEKALSLAAQGQFEEAAELFDALGDYEDSADQALACRYEAAWDLQRQDDYEGAAAAFEELGDYRDSAELAIQCRSQIAYNRAKELLAMGAYAEALELYELLGDYCNSREQAQICRDWIPYIQAEQFLAEGNLYEAATTFYRIRGFQDSWDRAFACWRELTPLQTLSIAKEHVVGVRNDGTVIAMGNGGRCNVRDWTDIVSVSAGLYHTVGLRADGTVVAVGSNQTVSALVVGWTDIIAVAAARTNHMVGLRSDGNVVASWGYDEELATWHDVVAIAAGDNHVVALRADGTVVASGDNQNGQCDVFQWTDVVAISAKGDHTVAVRADGTVVAVGANGWGQCDVSGWTDVVAVSAGITHTVGLRSDGTAVAVGRNSHEQCELSGWHGIVAVFAGDNESLALRADGTLVSAGTYARAADWTDIRLPDGT